jgi:hypothetical protein
MSDPHPRRSTDDDVDRFGARRTDAGRSATPQSAAGPEAARGAGRSQAAYLSGYLSSYLDRNPAVRSAVADAERLVAATRGTNLDPIIQALDRRLLADGDEISPPVLVHLRRDVTTALDLGSAGTASGRQLAARILCSDDDRVRVPLLAALDGGLPVLVPTIAVTVFGGMRPAALAMASALAALIAVRGLGPFCADMGRPLLVDRLGPA